MKIVLNINSKQRVIKLEFEHFREVIMNTGRPGTKCILTIPDEDFEVHGFSICSEKDQFNKATGRKVALSRTLKMISADKEQRTEIWRQYFKQVKK